MGQLAILARWGGLGFLTALAIIVFFKLLSGSISLDGLLTAERKDGTTYFSVGRTQLLLFTLVAAVNYVRDVFSSPLRTSLPDISTGTLEMLGGSQLFYLVGKAHALWSSLSPPSSQKGNNS
jgi:hypothetical protein